jgi:tetratricopeptide (TPR) repeat protein
VPFTEKVWYYPDKQAAFWWRFQFLRITVRVEVFMDDVPLEITLEALGNVVASRTFSNSPNMARLLKFCVQETIAGRRQSQACIAKTLGYRNFNALEHSVVRREMGRLRVKLREYYDQEGSDDPVTIGIPKSSKKNGYSAEFVVRRPIASESENARYLQLSAEARHLWSSRRPPSIIEAIALYEEAIREDPEHSVSAVAGLSESYAFLALCGFPAHETMPKAKEWASRALVLDSGNPVATAVLAFVTSAYDWNWHLGEQLFQKAVMLAPHSVEVRCWYASHLICVGRFSEAIRQARKAQTLQQDPTPVLLSHIGKILFVAGDLDHALDLLRFTVDINPQFHFSHYYLGMVLVHRGDLDVGLNHLRQAAELAPEDPSVMAGLAHSLGMAGRVAESLECLAALTRIASARYVPPTDFATAYAGLGDVNGAFAALEQAFADKCLFLTWVHAWPPYKQLSSDPRLFEIVQRIGLNSASLRAAAFERR